MPLNKKFGHYMAATFALVAIFCATPLDFAPKAEVIDRIVAKINGDIVTLNDLRRASGPYMLSINNEPGALKDPKLANKIYSDVLQDMINTRLLLQEARELQLEISDDDVTRWVEGMAGRQNLQTEEFRQVLRSKGVRWQDYRRFVHDNLLKFRVIQIKLGSRIKITDDELRKAYREDFGTDPNKGVKSLSLSQIFIPIDAEDPEKAERAEKLAKSVHKQLKEGGDFAELARTFSLGHTAKEGGLLGEAFRPGDLPDDLEEPVFQTPAGEITELIRSKSGFNIFKVHSVQLERDKKTTERLAQLREQLYQQELNDRLTTWMESLRKGSYVKLMY